MKRLASMGLIAVLLLMGFGLSRDIYWRFLVKPIESAIVTLCAAVSAGQLFTAVQANCYRTTPANDYNNNTTDANISATAAISKSKISTASTWARADLPSQLAYEDEANTFTQAQKVEMDLGSQYFWTNKTTSGAYRTFAAYMAGIESWRISVYPTQPAYRIEDSGGVTRLSVDTSNGNTSTPGTYASTKACATGFTRLTGGPQNYCRRNDLTLESWTDATACTARTTGSSLPADAKFVNMQISWIAYSNNATGLRSNNVYFYSTSTCNAGTDVVLSTAAAREQVATTIGTDIMWVSDHVIVPLVGTDTFYTAQSNAGGNGNADISSFSIEGYWD